MTTRVTVPDQWAVGSPRELVRLLWDHFADHRRSLGIVALLSVVAAVLETIALVTLVPLAAAVSSADGRFRESIGPLAVDVGVGVLAAAALALVLLRGAVAILARVSEARLLVAYEVAVRRRGLASFLAASWPVQESERPGHLQNTLAGYVNRSQAGLRAVTMALTSGTGLAIMLIGATAIGGVAAVVVVVLLVCVGVTTVPLVRRSRTHAAEIARTTPVYANRLARVVTQAREIRLFRAMGSVTADVDRIVDDLGAHRRREQAVTNSTPLVFETIGLAAVVVGLGAIHVLDVSDITDLAAVALLLVRALVYGRALQAHYQTANNSAPYIAGLDEVLEGFETRTEDWAGREVDHVGRIECRDLSFGYRDSSPVLHDVTCTIEEGASIGVIGPSGSGKSTFAKLLLRLHRPDSGRIVVDGIGVEEIALSSWYDRVQLVPQDPQLLDGTIADNIRVHRSTVSDADVRRAAAAVGLDDEIRRLAHGYDTLLGPGDAQLSGGQRQRLAIARALVRDPSLVVFDEPTSALDVHSERIIRDLLADLRGRVTLVVVAHRLSTLQLCEQIMVFRDGRLQSFDERETLERRDRYYAEALRLSQLR